MYGCSREDGRVVPAARIQISANIHSYWIRQLQMPRPSIMVTGQHSTAPPRLRHERRAREAENDHSTPFQTYCADVEYPMLLRHLLQRRFLVINGVEVAVAEEPRDLLNA